MSAGAGRCLCWMYPAPGDSDPRGLQHPASHVRELGEHLAGPDPLPLLDAPGAGQPRPLRPAGHASEPGEHLASAGPLPRLDVLGTGRPDPAACWPRPRAERAPGRRRPAAAAGRARRRAAPTPATAGHVGELGEHPADAGPLPRLDVLGTGRPRPLRPAGYARELGGHLADAGPLPGLVPWPSSWCSPAAVDLAGPDPLPRLDVLGAGQPRPLRPASHVSEPGEHLASAGPLPLLDVPGTGRPRPLRPAGYARELGEHLADADPLPRLDVLGAGQPRPLRPVSADASPTCRVT